MLARLLATLKRRPRPTQDASGSARDLAAARHAVAQGDLARAEGILRPLAGGRNVSDLPAQRLLGSVLGAGGRLAEARAVLEAALAAEPDHPQALTDLGNVCRSSGQDADAEVHYRRAIALDPSARTARFNLAMLERQSGRSAAAIAGLYAMLETPAHAEALKTLVEWFCADARADQARAICELVLAREPGHTAAHVALRSLLLGCTITPEEALARAQSALAQSDGHSDLEILLNQAIALQYLGRHDEALAGYDRALVQDPAAVLVRFHRALALLARGEYERAWPDYELRLQSRDLPAPPRQLPRWQGESIPGQTLLVYGEQGIGDEIMFAACVPDLLKRCPRVVLACAAKLVPIFRRSFPGTVVIGMDRARDASPGSDRAGPVDGADGTGSALDGAVAMAAIGSLPGHLRRSRAQFPLHHGYLEADPQLVASYVARLRELPPGLKVGFAWRGGSAKSRQALRTLPSDAIATLLETPDAHFLNLQYDSSGEEPEIAAAIAAGKLTHWPQALADYEHTAALVCALHVTVSVCTAVIHLAGALGRDALVMAPFSPEWRYGIAGEAMPWYPSVRIIRQSAPGSWAEVVATVRARLRAQSA